MSHCKVNSIHTITPEQAFLCLTFFIGIPTPRLKGNAQVCLLWVPSFYLPLFVWVDNHRGLLGSWVGDSLLPPHLVVHSHPPLLGSRGLPSSALTSLSQLKCIALTLDTLSALSLHPWVPAFDDSHFCLLTSVSL